MGASRLMEVSFLLWPAALQNTSSGHVLGQAILALGRLQTMVLVFPSLHPEPPRSEAEWYFLG